MPLLLTVPQDSSLELSLNNGGSIQADPIDSAALTGGTPLSNVVFVDGGTSVAPASQDGSIGSPYSTLAAALTANALTGGTFLITPGDYSAEVLPVLSLDFPWHFVGLAFDAPDAFNQGPSTLLGAVTFADGAVVPFSEASFRSIKMGALTFPSVGGLALTDSAFTLVQSGAAEKASIKAFNCFFDSSGVECSTFDGDLCSFFGSQTIVADGGFIRLTRCRGQTSVNCTGAPGEVHVDPWSVPVLLTITSGTVITEWSPGAVAFNAQIQNLTASLASPQAQIDDIVAAGVALFFWTDNRVP